MRGSGKSLYVSLPPPMTGFWGSQTLRASPLALTHPTYYESQPSSPVLASATQPLNLPPAHALAEQLPPNASDRFLETFLPSGHPPLPGSLLRRPDLAEVLDILGIAGPAAFYNGGNLTLEMVAEVSVTVGGGVCPVTLQKGCHPPFLLCIVSGCMLHTQN